MTRGKKKNTTRREKKKKKKTQHVLYICKTVYLCPINTKMCEYANVLRNIFIY